MLRRSGNILQCALPSPFCPPPSTTSDSNTAWPTRVNDLKASIIERDSLEEFEEALTESAPTDEAVSDAVKERTRAVIRMLVEKLGRRAHAAPNFTGGTTVFVDLEGGKRDTYMIRANGTWRRVFYSADGTTLIDEECG